MSQVEINKVLESQAASFAASKSITKVVYDNVGSSALPDATHLRCSILPVPTLDPSLGASHKRYVGVFRLQYMFFGIGKGSKPLYTISDAAVDWFKRGSKFSNSNVTVNIDYTPDVSSIRYENNFAYVTIDIGYRCDIVKNN